MALTITNPGTSRDVQGVMGDIRYTIKDITFDDSYPTGGESCTAANFGLSEIFLVLISQKSDGYVAQYDYTNTKFEIYEAGADAAALDELGDTADASGIGIRVLVLGR
jgi:hypothetical protein